MAGPSLLVFTAPLTIQNDSVLTHSVQFAWNSHNSMCLCVSIIMHAIILLRAIMVRIMFEEKV